MYYNWGALVQWYAAMIDSERIPTVGYELGSVLILVHSFGK